MANAAPAGAVAVSTDPADYTWWPVRPPLTLDNGDVDVQIQLSDGRQWRGIIRPSAGVDVAAAIDAGVRAFIRKDRRWTRKSDRGGNA